MTKKILIMLLLTFIITSCGAEKEKNIIKKSFSVYTVQNGNLDNTSNLIGYTSGIKEVMLATKSPGRIIYLDKNVGDEVHKGELLAQLDGAEAKTGYSTANNIIDSLHELKKQTSIAYDGQIESINAKINQAKIGIKGVNIGLNDTRNITNSQLETAKTGIEQARLGVETAKRNLEETKKTLNSNKESIIEGGKSAITQSIILYKNVIDFSDKFLGITIKNKNYNDSFENDIGTKDIRHLRKTEKLFEKTRLDFIEYEKYYNKKIENKTPSEDEIIKGLKIAKKTAENQKELLKELYTVINNTITTINFSQFMINEYRKNISLFGSQVEQSLLSVQGEFTLGIKGSLQNLENFKTGKNKGISLLEKQIQLAQAGLETAKKTYEQYKQMSNGQINGVVTKKEIAESQLKEAYAGLKAIQAKKQASLKEIDTKITEAQGGKSSAGVMIENTKVISNISGIIIQKMAENGQVINAGMPIFMVADNSKIKIKTAITGAFYNSMKLGDNIDLSIEGSDKIIKGNVSLIAKSANRFTKKYSIEIEISNKDGEIPIGAMATLLIKQKTNSNKNNKNTIIPSNAIISKFSLPAVYLLEKGKARLKTIKIIRMGKVQTEIIGLKSLDRIIVSGKENIYDGEVLEKEVSEKEEKESK